MSATRYESLLKTVQLIWVIGWCLYSALSLLKPSPEIIRFAIVTALYATATIGIYRGSRLAWTVSVLPPMFVFFNMGYFVVRNYTASVSGHELYVDSPGTIYVVLINFLLGVVPAFLLLILFWINRYSLIDMWRRPK